MVVSLLDSALIASERDDRDFHVILIAGGAIVSGVLLSPKMFGEHLGSPVAMSDEMVYLLDATIISNGFQINTSPVELRRDSITAVLAAGHLALFGSLFSEALARNVSHLPTINVDPDSADWLSPSEQDQQ